MSIEQLQQDLKQVAEAAKALAGPLVTPSEIAVFLRDNLVPLIESHIGESAEMDESIYGLVQEAEDVLHEDNAAVFAGIITSGAVLVTELGHRAGNDQRLLKLIKEWRALAKQGEQILEDITIPDDPEADAEGEGESMDAAETPAAEGKAE